MDGVTNIITGHSTIGSMKSKSSGVEVLDKIVLSALRRSEA